MKIEDNRKNGKSVALQELYAGDAFESYDDIYIVTEKICENKVTCVSVETGNVYGFAKSALVIPIDAKVVIE